ncbi:deoxyribonuclease-2-beta-like [Perca flavescens]|uniref:deoxyribonuclease-2-beta-like n=1 Tax=Perca flavescens TaxID=8167 RepID=UPI00106E0AB6|nr:deoxyribonuclease-2-beta-like [Perca flavescens]
MTRYIIYKASNVKDKTNIKTTGLEYIYIDSKDQTKKTSKDHKDNNGKDKLINHPDGVLANTLKPIFTTSSTTTDFGFISYSDQPPAVNGVKPPVGPTYGHSKGVVMMEKDKTGIWLLHSTPRFPFKRDQNFWPSNGAMNAQTFICVTFKYNQFKQIGQHLLNIAAYPFDHHIPLGFHQELIDVTEKKKTPGQKIQDLTSAGLTGTVFRSFAKHNIDKDIKDTDAKRFDGDLYRTIAEEYGSVRVQTWHSKPEEIINTQNQPQVLNIECVKTDLGNGKVAWGPTKDHSKWCVAVDNNNHLICIADMNRCLSQYKRPGGALCFEHQQASELFKGLIAKPEECPPKTQKRLYSSSSTPQSSKKAELAQAASDSDCNCDCDCDDDSD